MPLIPPIVIPLPPIVPPVTVTTPVVTVSTTPTTTTTPTTPSNNTIGVTLPTLTIPAQGDVVYYTTTDMPTLKAAALVNCVNGDGTLGLHVLLPNGGVIEPINVEGTLSAAGSEAAIGKWTPRIL